jgi:hypothetical protein
VPRSRRASRRSTGRPGPRWRRPPGGSWTVGRAPRGSTRTPRPDGPGTPCCAPCSAAAHPGPAGCPTASSPACCGRSPTSGCATGRSPSRWATTPPLPRCCGPSAPAGPRRPSTPPRPPCWRSVRGCAGTVPWPTSRSIGHWTADRRTRSRGCSPTDWPPACPRPSCGRCSPRGPPTPTRSGPRGAPGRGSWDDARPRPGGSPARSPVRPRAPASCRVSPPARGWWGAGGPPPSDAGREGPLQSSPGRCQSWPCTCSVRKASTVSYQTCALPGVSTQWFSSGK